MATWDILATFNITQSGTQNILSDNSYMDLSKVSSIEVDGRILTTLSKTYNFSTTGTHTVKYKAVDPTNASSFIYFFQHITTIEEVRINSTVTSIGRDEFGGCTSLISVTIPNTVTSIGFGAFNHCTSLTNITIPNSVTVIDGEAFRQCTLLSSVTIPGSVTTLATSTFIGATSLSDVTILYGVTSIGANAFDDCTSLSRVTIPNSVTTIGNYAFHNCTSLTNITISNSVTTIGNYTFSHCHNIESITIPNSVTTIGTRAFEELRLITSVTIPSSVTSINDDVFSSCDSLRSITVDSNNTVYDSRDNCNAIIETATNKLINACLSSFIPNNVTALGSGAFRNIDGLTNITIPSSVTSIGAETFQYNYGLTNITIPSSVTTIGVSAFRNCSNLTSITVEAITPPTLELYSSTSNTTAFDDTNDCPIYVPEESVNDYKTTWSKYESRIQAMPIIPDYNPQISYLGVTQDDYYVGSTRYNDILTPTNPTTGGPAYSAAVANSTNIYWNNAYLPSTGAYINYTYELLWNLDYAITHGGDANVQANWNETDPTSYSYIQNKPTIPVVPTNISAFTNDAHYATTSDIPVVPTNVSAFTNDAHYATTSDISNKANASDAVGSLQLAFDTSYNTITLSGRRVDGTEFTVSDTVDLPLETMIVNGVYNTQSKSIIFTKQDGSTLTVNLSPLIEGLQEEITRNNKLDGSLIEDDSITLDQLAEDVTSELDKASTSIQGIKVNNVLITPDENNIVNIIVETPTPSGYFLTLNGVKKHLNIDYAFTDDDDYLNGLIDVAQTMVARHLDYSSVDALLEKYDNDIPSPIIHACYLLIGNYYMNRESVSPTNMTPIPQSYEYLLAMYKNRTNYQG